MHVGRRAILMVSAVVVAAGTTACGRVDQDTKPVGNRSPASIQLSGAVNDDGVSVSKKRVGGGPAEIILSNQSKRPTGIRLVTDAGSVTARMSTLAPGAIGSLKAVLDANTTYEITPENGDAAKLRVGAERGSADGDLLLP